MAPERGLPKGAPDNSGPPERGSPLLPLFHCALPKELAAGGLERPQPVGAALGQLDHRVALLPERLDQQRPDRLGAAQPNRPGWLPGAAGLVLLPLLF